MSLPAGRGRGMVIEPTSCRRGWPPWPSPSIAGVQQPLATQVRHLVQPEESSAQLSLACAQRRRAEPLTETVNGLLDTLGPVERFWAFPGPQAFQQVRRAFTAAKYERFAAMVRGINQALVTGSYRAGAAAEEDDVYYPDAGPGERSRSGRPSFEVLIVEDMTEAQEQALREGLRHWRRPDDPFSYDIVVVSSFDDAVKAARLNFRLQACVIRRRFAHHSRYDLSSLGQFEDVSAPGDLMERSPDDRAQSLARSLATPVRARSSSNWIRDMVDFYGLDIFLAETSATCGGLDSLLEPTGPLREAQQLAAKTFGARQTYFVTNGTSTANKIVVQALVQPGDIVLVDRNCHQSHLPVGRSLVRVRQVPPGVPAAHGHARGAHAARAAAPARLPRALPGARRQPARR
jgi:Orn/Lys/Arg decarboxylase, major domain